MAQTSRSLGRRGFLLSTSGAVAVGSLTACGKDSGGTSKAGSSGAKTLKEALPTYAEPKQPTADLPGDGGVVEPGYFTYPTELTQSVQDKPGKGSKITVSVMTFSEPASNDSAYAKAVNDALGSTLAFQPIPASDHEQKITTILSSGKSVPDVVSIPSWGPPAKLQQAYEGLFQPLNEVLSGDKAKDYPNLAAMPTAAWQAAAWKHELTSSVTPAPLAGFITFVRSDLLQKAGVEMPTSPDEFVEVCKALTRPDENRYAFDSLAMSMTRLWGLPLSWSVEDDKVYHPWERPEFMESFEFYKKLWDAGYVHPSAREGNADSKGNFAKGETALMETGHDAWYGMAYEGQNPNMEAGIVVDGLRPFSATGGKGKVFGESPELFRIFINKNVDADKLKEILGCLNYMSAPFGTKEYQLLRFGIEGTHFEMKDGVPVKTPQGEKEITDLRDFTASSPRVTFMPPSPDFVKRVHAYQSDIAPLRVQTPLDGMYVELTSEQKASEKAPTDTMKDVLLGRKDMSALTEAIDSWKKAHADAIREVYQKTMDENK